MEQCDLFAAAPAPAWRPGSDKVRARLARILAEAREAEVMPREPARWRADLDAELTRFGVGAEPDTEG